MIKKTLLTLFVALLVLIAVLVYNTLQIEPAKKQVAQVALPETDDAAVQRFANALKIPTVSYENPADFDSIPFLDFIDFLANTYPLSDSLMDKQIINNYSLLYKWEGSNPALAPVIFMGHIDVVPVAAPTATLNTEKSPNALKANMNSRWDAAPFGGEIKEGFIWGRGAVDDKLSVIGNIETAERLLVEGYQPTRTIYFAFGHDEEIGGEAGAVEIVKYLKSQNVQPAYVMDEGGIITTTRIPKVSEPVALIGVAEKGFISVTLSVDIPGGHSSMPGNDLAVEMLSNAIVKLRNNKFEKKITPPVAQFIEHIAPLMPFVEQMVFANIWLFESVLLDAYEASESGNATVRTTTAPTIFNSGYKDNILPTQATATVNFRILPGETSEDVMAHIKNVVGDERIQLKKSGFLSEPSPVSSITNEGYQQISQCILQVFPEVTIVPYLVVGGTDSRYYTELCENIYRFMPVSDPIGFHDINERVAVEDYKKALQFYYQLIKEAGEG
jgi:carboxypeptidase PM20D1